MKKIILGIETSCDETSVAIVDSDKKIYAHQTYSKSHALYGGVVPELGARAHLEKIAPLVQEAVEESGFSYTDLDAIAAACGPGLIGGVVVGALFGKGLAASLDIPFYAVNHLEGHALTVRLCEDVEFPFLLLLISGGHCQFLEVRGLGKYKLLGETLDDALGEAFDKVARMMDVDYPGGPAIEGLAKSFFEKIPQENSLETVLKTKNTQKYALIPFPRPLLGTKGCHFSFSGLKTAVRQYIVKNPSFSKEHVAASFQHAVVDTLCDRTKNALSMASTDITCMVIAGGVASNQAIRTDLLQIVHAHNIPLRVAPVSLCTDNAAMIAWVGVEKMNAKCASEMDFEPRPRWPLEELMR